MRSQHTAFFFEMHAKNFVFATMRWRGVGEDARICHLAKFHAVSRTTRQTHSRGILDAECRALRPRPRVDCRSLFGLTLPATRSALTGLDPWLIGLGRGVFAGAIAALVLASTRTNWPPRETWRGFSLPQAASFLGFPMFATLAMQYAPASHGAVILAILPLLTAVGGVLVAGERPSIGFWICSIAGTLAVLTFAILEGAGQEGFHAADLLLAAAVVSAAIGYAEAAGWREPWAAGR